MQYSYVRDSVNALCHNQLHGVDEQFPDQSPMLTSGRNLGINRPDFATPYGHYCPYLPLFSRKNTMPEWADFIKVKGMALPPQFFAFQFKFSADECSRMIYMLQTARKTRRCNVILDDRQKAAKRRAHSHRTVRLSCNLWHFGSDSCTI